MNWENIDTCVQLLSTFLATYIFALLSLKYFFWWQEYIYLEEVKVGEL